MPIKRAKSNTITARYFNDNGGRVLQKIAGAISPTAAFDFFLYQGDNALGSAEIIDYTTTGTSTSHFGFNFTPISSQYPAITPGTYVVQAGDSLQGIAQAIYGDASLWYLIADANPIFQNSTTLTPGTVLQLPNTVIASKNNSTTFKPFSAQDLIGDVTPPLPPPPAAKSNVFASLIIVAVAVVASVVTYGALAPATTSGAFAAGAAAGAASSASSQVAGIALGVQNSFSFDAVGRAALVGGLSAGITDKIGSVDIGLKGQAAQAFQAAVSTTANQSVNIALGYQNNFSFAAVAASAVAAGLVPSPTGLGNNGRENPGIGSNSFSRFANDFGRNLARNGLRNSVQIALEGGGKINIANIAGDAFGNALGNSIVRELKTADATRQQKTAALRVEIAVEEAGRADRGQGRSDIVGTVGGAGAGGSPSSVSLSAEEFDSLLFSGRLGTAQYAQAKLEQLGIQRATDGGSRGFQTFAAEGPSTGTVSVVDFPYPASVDYFSQRSAALRAADAEVLASLYGLPGAVRSGLQNDFAALGGRFDALSQSSNSLLRLVGNAGFIGSGLLYAGAEVALPFDTFGGVAAGAIGGEVLGAVVRIPAVSAALNMDLGVLAGRLRSNVLQPKQSLQVPLNGGVTDAEAGLFTSPVNAAGQGIRFQNVFPYLNQDVLVPTAIPTGTRLAQIRFSALDPGKTTNGIFFATEDAVRAATLANGSVDANILQQGLQIAGINNKGVPYENFRGTIQFFDVAQGLASSEAASGLALANPLLNPAGFPSLQQVVISETSLLKLRPLNGPGDIINMVNTKTPAYFLP